MRVCVCVCAFLLFRFAADVGAGDLGLCGVARRCAAHFGLRAEVGLGDGL